MAHLLNFFFKLGNCLLRGEIQTLIMCCVHNTIGCYFKATRAQFGYKNINNCMIKHNIR